MQISEFFRGLIGALASLLATLILLLCLSETHERLGTKRWGVDLIALSSWSRYVSFHRVWFALLIFGTINAILGYVLGSRLDTKRHVEFALAAAVLAGAGGWLWYSHSYRQFGRAGANTVWVHTMITFLAGGCGGTWLPGLWDRGRRRRRDD